MIEPVLGRRQLGVVVLLGCKMVEEGALLGEVDHCSRVPVVHKLELVEWDKLTRSEEEQQIVVAVVECM